MARDTSTESLTALKKKLYKNHRTVINFVRYYYDWRILIAGIGINYDRYAIRKCKWRETRFLRFCLQSVVKFVFDRAIIRVVYPVLVWSAGELSWSLYLVSDRDNFFSLIPHCGSLNEGSKVLEIYRQPEIPSNPINSVIARCTESNADTNKLLPNYHLDIVTN